MPAASQCLIKHCIEWTDIIVCNMQRVTELPHVCCSLTGGLRVTSHTKGQVRDEPSNGFIFRIFKFFSSTFILSLQTIYIFYSLLTSLSWYVYFTPIAFIFAFSYKSFFYIDLCMFYYFHLFYLFLFSSKKKEKKMTPRTPCLWFLD